ncbi:glycogen-binding domain-containing protein [Corallibacter sp.]|uniref:glycogen-binding domain-containing protein n=1 Tax=Corallibacter sp. TaxID=2038084 RepID=UPI003AB80C5F
MNFKLVYTLIFLLFTQFSISQNNDVLGYKIEGDDVVFTFDIRDYKKFTNEHTQEQLDFNDFDIENVVVSGDFNLWSRDQWKMTKINENIYQLRKNISDFTDEFSWEFKFVINNKYWAEPSKKATNLTPAVDENGRNLYVYNLKLFAVTPNKDGNICFKLHGYENAKKVILTGSFNKWDENLFRMSKTKDGWELTLDLKPGEYEYKFIVDGHWIYDTNNPSKRKNEYDGYNSVINIKVPITFNLNGFSAAKNVILAGSFNDWNESDIKMSKTESGWETTILLSGGKHHYKYIIDGEWIVDPKNPIKEYDNHGNINSVKMVK